MTKEENKYVDVNGNQVMDLSPDYNRPLALVDLDVLIRLTSNLHISSVYSIRRTLLNDIRNTDTDSGHCLEDLVKICEEFTAFHNTVNLIKKIDHPLNVTKHQLDDEPITGTNLDEL
jgi:hypothetical protein